jgi:hypothetical protein
MDDGSAFVGVVLFVADFLPQEAETFTNGVHSGFKLANGMHDVVVRCHSYSLPASGTMSFAVESPLVLSRVRLEGLVASNCIDGAP